MTSSYEIPGDRLTIWLPAGFTLRETEDFVHFYEADRELAVFPAHVPQAALLDGINECLRLRRGRTVFACEAVEARLPEAALRQAPASAGPMPGASAPVWRLDRPIQAFVSSFRRWGDAAWRVAGLLRFR